MLAAQLIAIDWERKSRLDVYIIWFTYVNYTCNLNVDRLYDRRRLLQMERKIDFPLYRKVVAGLVFDLISFHHGHSLIHGRDFSLLVFVMSRTVLLVKLLETCVSIRSYTASLEL